MKIVPGVVCTFAITQTCHSNLHDVLAVYIFLFASQRLTHVCVLYLVSTHQANAKASCFSGINLLAKHQNVVNNKLLLFCILEMIIFRQLEHQLYDQIDDPHITLSGTLLWLSL